MTIFLKITLVTSPTVLDILFNVRSAANSKLTHTFYMLQKVVYANSGLFFLPLCTRLANDESVNCRKLTAATVKTLIEKVRFRVNY